MYLKGVTDRCFVWPKPVFLNNHYITKIAFAMKIWEKSKKDLRRQDDRELFKQESHKKKKLQPVEKVKYRMRGVDDIQEE